MAITTGMSLWIGGYAVFGLPVHNIAMRFNNRLAVRLPRPWSGHRVYARWLIVLLMVHTAILLLTALTSGSISSVMASRSLYERRVIDDPWWTIDPNVALVTLVIGVAVFALPLTLLGAWYDRVLRGDGPGEGEVRALHLFRIAMTVSVSALIVLDSVLLGMAA
jgi:hypothetical protein